MQQGHPLSAPPAAAGQSQTVPGQCNADDTENAAPHSPAGSEDTAEMFDVLNSAVDSSSLRTKTARCASLCTQSQVFLVDVLVASSDYARRHWSQVVTILVEGWCV